MKQRTGKITKNVIATPLSVIIFVLFVFNFTAFRWISSREELKVRASIEGVLRSEYATSNSYALSKAITDLESLNILRCSVLIEKLDTERTFYDTSGRSSCVLPAFFSGLFTHEANLHAVNGLLYQLRFQLPIRWQSLLLEVMSYILIVTLGLLYHRHARAQSVKEAVAEALINQSKQVSHDIRSPLSALNMVVTSIKDLPEDKRLIIRNAVQRINDIANQLLHQGKISKTKNQSLTAYDAATERQVVMLVGLVDSIVSEKRVQFRDRMNIEILNDLDQGYGLFASVSATEFSRAISNLINNSVEALPEGNGRITVAIRSSKKTVQVIISDNGCGIPPRILDQLGERGSTYGKEESLSGSGLGLYHARQAAEAAGGALSIQSRVGVGTMITMTLPRAETPTWFVDKLVLPFGATVVSSDDDQTIHQIWSERIASANASTADIKHIMFLSLNSFESWLGENRGGTRRFLVDYEFLGQTGTGLDVIERCGIAAQSILVTSRYDEPSIMARAHSLGIRIIPKSLAPFVPFEIEKPS